MFSVNNLRLGTITATDYCLGSVPVQKMYLGSVLVFDRTPAEEVRYFFEVSPTADIEFEALDSEKTLTVTSYSQVYSGDTPSGSVTPITPSIQESDFTTHNIVNNSDGTFTITLKANDYYQDEDGSLSKRNGTITVSQSQSGDSTQINVSQSPIIPTVQNRWLRLEYAAEEDQYITVNKGDVELPYVSDWKNYVFPKKSTGIKPIRWNADITNQDFMHEVLAYMSQQTIVYVDEAENAQENKSTYTAADSMCIATSTGNGLYFQELLKGSGIENGEVTFKIDGNGYWGQFYKCFDGCSWNKITIQFMQDNIHISSMNGAFRGCIINELNILDANGDPATTKHLAARDLSGMCEWTYIDNFPDIIDWESLDQNFTTGFGWAFSYAIPLISVAQHGTDREASSNTVKCGTFIQSFQRCSSLQSIGPVLDLSRVPGQSSDNGKAFEQCTALTDVRIRNLNGPTWHFDDDTQSGNIPNLDQASVTYLFDNLMDLTTYDAEDTSGTRPKSDHGDLYCPAEWQDKITSEMIIAASAKNWNIYIGGELQTVGDTRYTFTVPHSTISIPAEAKSGYFTLSWESYKQDVVNGEVQDAKTKVGVVTNSLDAPDWIQLSSQEEGELGNSLTFNFSDNTTASERSYTFQLTQQETSDKRTVVVTQAGADIETTYTWNVTPTTVTIDGTNTATINVTSYKQQWIGDIQQGSPTPVDFQYTNPGLEESIQANKVDKGNGLWTITLSGGSPSTDITYQMVFTANEGDNTTSVTVNKVVAGRNYGDITITEFTYPDIAPASGSTLTPTLSYTQSWGYGDSTTGGGTITSGAILQFAGGAVNASNGQYTYTSKGKELSEQTDTQVTVTVSLNGKTKTATANASQAANTRTWSSLKAEYNDNTDFENPAYIAGADGKIILGTAANDKITAYVNIYKIWTYTSGSTSKEAFNNTTILTDANWIHDNGKSESDFIVDNRGTTLGDERTGSVWAIVDDMKSNVANVLQKANEIIDTQYTKWTITQSNIDNVSAEGDTITISPSIKRTKTDTYTSTATKQTEETSTDFYLMSNESWAVVDGNRINVQQNTGKKRTAAITITIPSGKYISFTITQSTGQTITSYGDITINGGSATDIPASGGTVKASGCTATIQVTYSSGSTGTVTVPTGNITYTEVNAASLGTTVKARTKVGTSTCNVSYQGKSASKQIDVYQQANVKTEGEIEYGDLTPEFKLEKTTAAVTGDEIEYTARFTRTQSRTDTWTSGKSEVVDLGIDVEYGTVDYVTPGTHNRVDWVTRNLADTGSEYEYKAVIAANTTSSSRSFQIELYYDGYGYIQSKTITQGSGEKLYAKPVISEVSMNDVPASGMTAGSYLSDEPEFQQLINSFKVTQTWGYGSTTGGGTKIYTWPDDDNLGVALIKLSANVPSKGTTTSSRTNTNQQLRLQVGPNLVDGHTMLDLYQEANTRTAGDIKYGDWQVDVSVNPDTIDSAGGTRTINRTASRTRTQTYNYTSGATSQEAMSNETDTPTLSSNQTWCTLNNNNATIARNDTTSSRTVTITGTHQGKSDTCTITQSARQVESYGDINISGGSVNGDIPASGGSKSASGCTATIRVNYDNDTYENVSVPSSNISYSSVSGSNLGTTSKARTKVGTSRCTVSYQGKTATKDFDVYQQANSSTATDIAYGTWQVSISANPTSVAASGGTSTITRNATRTRKQNYTWTSGATSQSDLSNETATPTLSISGTGFSLNGTTVTATSNVPARTYTLQVSNPTGDLEEGPDQELETTVTSTYTQPSSNSRSCTVTATHGGVSKQVTISQSGQSQSSGNQDWTVAKGTNMQTATKSGSTIIMVPNAEYGNKNETYTAQCTVTQTTSNKTQIVQGRWYKGYLNVSPETLDFTADGGTKIIDIDTNLNWQVMP